LEIALVLFCCLRRVGIRLQTLFFKRRAIPRPMMSQRRYVAHLALPLSEVYVG
jgi:hypothetical protein